MSKSFLTRAGLLVSVLILSLLVAGLSGCGEKEGPSIAGTWAIQPPSTPGTFIANADHSFTIKMVGGQTSSGRWESTSSGIKIYRDIRDGGDDNFGEGGDGAAVYKLSSDLMTMTSVSKLGTAPPLVMKKQGS